MFPTVTLAAAITDATDILAEIAGPLGVMVALWAGSRFLRLFRSVIG
jgi:hypothetical protein